MKAMVLHKTSSILENPQPLILEEAPEPKFGDDELLVKVSACGVCHTELDEIEGRTPPSQFPVIPGHQVVGKVLDKGKKVKKIRINDRVGIAWIYSSCGVCSYCLSGNENLCPDFRATGRDANGGYAEYMVVKEDFAFKIPGYLQDAEAAPLLCAGAVGYRSLKLCKLADGQNFGLTGFGASAHLVLKLVKHLYPGSKIFVFARSEKEQEFARELGADWVGTTTDYSPEKLHVIIDTTPAWMPVVEAMKNILPGGRLVINAIRKENTDINYLLNLDYQKHLWMEKEIKTVANISCSDVREFLDIAAEMEIHPEYQEYALEDANRALYEIKTSKIKGAKVLKI